MFASKKLQNDWQNPVDNAIAVALGSLWWEIYSVFIHQFRLRTFIKMPPPTKRRKTEPAVEEINFDLSARQEYLTGFHKRKVQRAKHAQDAAEKRARAERVEERKKVRCLIRCIAWDYR